MENNQKNVCSATGSKYEIGSFSDRVHRYISASESDLLTSLKEVFSRPSELFRWIDGLIEELAVHTRERASEVGTAVALSKYQDKWLQVVLLLMNTGAAAEAKKVLLRFYQTARELELASQERFDKTSALRLLAEVSNQFGQVDEAKRYAFLELFEVLRNSPSEWQSSAAYQRLVGDFQVAENLVDNISLDGRAFLEKKAWDASEPELTWLHARPLLRQTSRTPLEFSKILAETFLARLDRPAGSAKEKGNHLEVLVAYLFGSEKDFEVIGPFQSPDSQTDLLVLNRSADPAVASLGDYFLVEAKNWEKRVSATIVREFATRLRYSRCHTGILVSKLGVTGDRKANSPTGAERAILKEYQRSGIAVLVIDREALESIATGALPLPALVLNLFESVRFDFR